MSIVYTKTWQFSQVIAYLFMYLMYNILISSNLVYIIVLVRLTGLAILDFYSFVVRKNEFIIAEDHSNLFTVQSLVFFFQFRFKISHSIFFEKYNVKKQLQSIICLPNIYRENYMFTTIKIPLFIFTITNETFSKISSSLSGKRLLCPCYLYI